MADPKLGKDACINGVVEAALRDGLIDDDIKQIRGALDVADARRGQGDVERLFMDAKAEIANDLEIGGMVEKRNRYINILREREILDIMDEANQLYDQPWLGLQAKLGGVNSPLKGGRFGADQRGVMLEGRYIGGITAELKEAGLLSKFMMGSRGGMFGMRENPEGRRMQLNVARELENLSSDAPSAQPVSGDADARKIAEIVQKYQDMARQDANRAGAYIRKRKGRITRQTHDLAKLRAAGREKWKRDIRPLLDERAFADARSRRDEINARADEVEGGVRSMLGQLSALRGREAKAETVAKKSVTALNRTVDERRSRVEEIDGLIAENQDALDEIARRRAEGLERSPEDMTPLDLIRAVRRDDDQVAANLRTARRRHERFFKVLQEMETRYGVDPRYSEDLDTSPGSGRSLDELAAERRAWEADLAAYVDRHGGAERILTTEDAAELAEIWGRAANWAKRASQAQRRAVPLDLIKRFRDRWRDLGALKEQEASINRFDRRLKQLIGQRDRAAKSLETAEWELAIRQEMDEVKRLRSEAKAVRLAVDDVDDFLDRAYNGLTTGIRQRQLDNDLMFAFKGPGNVAKKASASRVLEFKDAEAWFQYNEKYGAGSLSEAIFSELQQTARTTALMQVFGTNPRGMFDRIVDKTTQQLTSRDGLAADPDGARKAAYIQQDFLSHLMTRLDGTGDAIPSGPVGFGAAKWSAILRALTNMNSLGMAFLSSLTDIGTAAAAPRTLGKSVARSLWDGASTPLKGLVGAERRNMARMMGIGLTAFQGTAMARFDTTDDMRSWLGKTQGMFFLANGLAPWTDAIQIGGTAIAAKHLADNAHLDFNQIERGLRDTLQQYDIGSADWDVLRRHGVGDYDGETFMTPQDLINAPLPSAVVDALHAKLSTFFTDYAKFVTPTPGAVERTILIRGTNPGTITGELLRFATQFKSFPTAVISKMYGRLIYGRGAKSLKHAFLRGEADLVGIAMTAAAMTILGAMAMTLKDVAKGREPREPETREQWAGWFLAAMAQGGGLGIFGDFFFQEQNRFGGGLIASAAGPVAGRVEQVASTFVRGFQGAARGDEDLATDFAGDVFRTGKDLIPGVNLIYTKAALDYLFFYQIQEYLSPGYLRRMERRMKRENNQEFLIPPSQAIPRGGGDRLFEGVRE